MTNLVLDDIGGLSLDFPKILQALLVDCSSLLDLGCCECNQTKSLKMKKLYVDIVEYKNHDEPFLKADIRDLPKITPQKSFDSVTMIDVIEHLRKQEGWKLIKEAEDVARVRAIHFTPYGSLWETTDDNPASHHSGWLPEEFSGLGYQTCLWPKYHKWTSGDTHGAFIAWKTLNGTREILPEDIESLLRGVR
jgi:hypothetical protein